MYSIGSSNTHTGTPKFTTHAAGHILKHDSTSALHRHDDTNHPLLNELNINMCNEIKRLVKNTFPICNVRKIHQVYVPEMYGMYMLRKEEIKLDVGQFVQEKLLYHVTTESRAIESLSSGLDWRRTRRNKFGCGVSFSDDADYANYYADKFSNEDTRVIMICSVLVKETYVVPRQYQGRTLVTPPVNFDTTMSYNGRVFVKYNDNEFYPLYFVYYRQRPEYWTRSKYHPANSRPVTARLNLNDLLDAMNIYDDIYQWCTTMLPTTKTMYRDRNRSNFGSSRLTAHATQQLQRRHNKSTSRSYETGGQLLNDLSHEEYKRLKCQVYDTFPMCNINLIHRVNAPQMYGMYLLRKEEMKLTSGNLVQEIILYHVTSKTRAIKSLKSGLDWRCTRRSKFGCGVSFSDDADYANYYADKFSGEASRVIIVCTVLVSKSHPVSGKRNEEDLIVPPGTADTTMSTNRRVYVKYNDYDFYPLYLMYYQWTQELINESKYLPNNSHNRRRQNHWVMQKEEQDRAQRQQELQEQHYLEQQEQARRRQLQLEQARRRQLQLEQERQRQLQLEQARRRQLQLEQERHQQDQTRNHESKNSCLIL
ncbi:uncharacterized protein LOC112600108 [Melanaphis sacchari]|uniref:uncharacterized protein LOC112600108 n=1 Tax=Melanaphis sacchari TaxID=742174 RepID=UPI000DC134F2|nr:uncharacterized protein LOC112600108 [Melanaphis sacchari]